MSNAATPDSATVISCVSINNAKVQAFGDMHRHNGGPVMHDACLSALRHIVKNEIADSFADDVSYPDQLSGEWNYIGPAFAHFGHAMAESIHRILPSVETFNCKNWLLVGEPGISHQLPSVLSSVFAFLGVAVDDVKVVVQNTIVERLNICKQGSTFGGYVDPAYLNRSNDYCRKRLDIIFLNIDRPEKIFVSRVAIKHGGNILGESYMAEFLQLNDFYIFHPENHDLPTQMDYYRKSHVTIFSEGSACHGIELLSNLNEVFLLQRRPESSYIFDAMITPRVSRYERLPVSIYIGTAAMHPYEERALGEWGVSLLDVSSWLSAVNDILQVNGDQFDVDLYFKRAASDFEDYVSYHKGAGTRLVSEEEIEKMRKIVHRIPA